MRAVCYQCSSVTVEPSVTRCPTCGFLLIAEVGAIPEVAPPIEHIFHRTSVSVGAPPLPGVDAGPRKAQLLMEARKKRIERRRTEERRAQTARETRRIRARWVAAATAIAACAAIATSWLAGAL